MKTLLYGSLAIIKGELPEETELSDSVNIQGPLGTVPVILGTATISTPSVNPQGPRMVSGYGLRNRPRPIPIRQGWTKSRVSKTKVSFDGLFSTDESSQDSRIVSDTVDEPEEENVSWSKSLDLVNPRLTG